MVHTWAKKDKIFTYEVSVGITITKCRPKRLETIYRLSALQHLLNILGSNIRYLFDIFFQYFWATSLFSRSQVIIVTIRCQLLIKHQKRNLFNYKTNKMIFKNWTRNNIRRLETGILEIFNKSGIGIITEVMHHLTNNHTNIILPFSFRS